MQVLGLTVYQSYHATENIDNTRYDNPKKLMKQTSFNVNKFRGTNPKKNNPFYQIEIVRFLDPCN